MAELIFSRDLQLLMAKRPALRDRIERVVAGHFPEIARARFGRASRGAYYDFRSGTVRLNSGSSAYVIGHELVHFLQDARHCGGATCPGGERACDVFLFARSPALVADLWAGEACYLIRGRSVRALRSRFARAEGQRMVHEVCAEAVRRRAAGTRNYIQWAEREIGARVEARAVTPFTPRGDR